MEICAICEILGKQNELFPSGSVIKCLLTHPASVEREMLVILVNLTSSGTIAKKESFIGMHGNLHKGMKEM